MIDAGNFGNVVDVIDQRFQGRAGDFGGPFALDAVGVKIGDGLSLRLEFVGVGLDGIIAVFGLRFGRLAVVLVDEGVVEIYLDDTTVRGDSAEHVVGPAARMTGEGARGRVRGDKWWLGDGDRVIERLVGDVRDVDEHCEAVRLPANKFASARW